MLKNLMPTARMVGLMNSKDFRLTLNCNIN